MSCFVLQVVPVIDHSVRALCAKPYPLHPKGCPNFTKCDRCPPKAALYDRKYDLSKPVYAVVNEYNLAAHVDKMKVKNPAWSERQLYCVLYWQNTARKQLDTKLKEIIKIGLNGYEIEKTPEAMGVNITETLRRVKIQLEWPPKQIARQVALLAIPKGN